MTPSEIESATFRLLAQSLNRLLHRVPRCIPNMYIFFLALEVNLFVYGLKLYVTFHLTRGQCDH